MHMHGGDAVMMAEHMAAMDLVPRDAATHIAISNGDWFDPATWHSGEVPGDDAKVLIPEGIAVNYGGTSDARLFTVRVDGDLDFATDDDSRMVFDTMVVSPTGRLEIGTEANPVGQDFSVELVVANNGPIDVDWDPTLLSRGIISHGETSIHGAAKDSHEKVVEDPMAGDTSITFDEIPAGWGVGDKIVIAGTSYEGHKWDNMVRDVVPHPSEDEVRVITSIEGNTIHFDTALEFDHDTPRADLKTSVANYTRNVSVETEGGIDAEVHERGHVMFMHSDDVDVRYAEFHQLGRTDKSETSRQADDFGDELTYDSNVQGRYALHLHRTGVEDQEDPAMVVGNAVWGSPGWGFVHHDSNAVLENNASFDTFGAGFVAETGNETGSWTDNIAIFAEGTSWATPKNATDLSEELFDTAKGGHGFWFQGRMIDSDDNVAASVNTGFVYFHRNGDDRMIDNETALSEFSGAFFGDDYVHAGGIPITEFQGNEAFAAREGLHVVKGNPQQGHDVWSHIDDFTAWNVTNGVWLEYTAHYLLTDLDLIGKEPTAFSDVGRGVGLGKNVSEVVITDSTIADFNNGFVLNKALVGFPEDSVQSTIIVDTTVTGSLSEDYRHFDPLVDWVGSSAELSGHTPHLDLSGELVYENYGVEIEGTKYDGLGEVEFPAGTEQIRISESEVRNSVKTDGYWTTSDGDDARTYFLTDVYFTDRLTGDVYYETHPVFIDNIADKLGQWHSSFKDAVHNGVQDITATASGNFAGDVQLDTPVLVATGADLVEGAETPVVEEDATQATELWNALTDGHGTMDLERSPVDELDEGWTQSPQDFELLV
jgi:hypothetical protein